MELLDKTINSYLDVWLGPRGKICQKLNKTNIKVQILGHKKQLPSNLLTLTDDYFL